MSLPRFRIKWYHLALVLAGALFVVVVAAAVLLMLLSSRGPKNFVEDETDIVHA